ncbi:MAG TPA: PAC2 family protein [Verrucomicrobiae bacterium]|nr:PAC2 family protein [Verrucomicrobiae bacterium]
MVLLEIQNAADLVAPVVIAALDGWVDAGGAATAAAGQVALGGTRVATFDDDRLYDYRARRPTLDIVDGRPATLEWPQLTLRRTKIGEQDILVLTGPEPDFRWRELSASAVELARRLGVAEWISLGAIPAAVPHTRDVPIMGTESAPGLLRANVTPGPDGILRVPAAAISVLDHAIARAGIPAVGYFAQVPHYVTGAYVPAALELLRVLSRHLGREVAPGALRDESRQVLERLDVATAADEGTRAYVERLEATVDEARRPSGDDLISEIERFLRESGQDGGRDPGGRSG